MSKFLRRLFGKDRSFGRNARRNRREDVSMLLGGEAAVVIDGGANRGKTIARWLEAYPGATIHGFEPIPELVELLNQQFGRMDNVHIHPVALGEAPGEVSFNVTQHNPASSALAPSNWSSAYWDEQTMGVVKTIEANVVRMDSVVSGEVDLMKLDLQGFELHALKGAAGLLPGVKVILTEIGFVPLYDGAVVLTDLDAFLREQGFRLFNLYDLYTQKDGQITHGDAIYVNTRFFPEPRRG